MEPENKFPYCTMELLNSERDSTGMPIGGCKLENRARELGVEVDA